MFDNMKHCVAMGGVNPVLTVFGAAMFSAEAAAAGICIPVPENSKRKKQFEAFE